MAKHGDLILRGAFPDKETADIGFTDETVV